VFSSRVRQLAILIATLFVLFTTTQVFANMFGFFNKSDFILSAPVKGQLFDDGKPVANTKVMRSLTYGDEYIDETVTDEQGYFTFSEKTIKTSKPANMFDNDSLVQHIYLENGTPEGIVLWYTLVSLHENSQTLKRLLADLECDISKEPETYDIPIEEDTSHTFAIYTSCKL